jgi:hypothetical protein
MSIESAADLEGITLAGRVVAEALAAMVRDVRQRRLSCCQAVP